MVDSSKVRCYRLHLNERACYVAMVTEEKLEDMPESEDIVASNLRFWLLLWSEAAIVSKKIQYICDIRVTRATRQWPFDRPCRFERMFRQTQQGSEYNRVHCRVRLKLIPLYTNNISGKV